ncbi:MAG TPA: hypothetical protein VK172_12700 [Lentimicrobium sp.]|nr:hypothetical protein [Lentimicrobium sp.]
MKTSLLALVILFFVVSTSAQTTKRLGLTAGIQGNQYGIAVPIRLTQSFSLIPSVAMTYVQENSTDLSTGLAARFYIKQAKVSPYATLRGGVGINLPYNDAEQVMIDKSTRMDIFGGIAFGGEYFIDEHFSFGVEAQGNVTKSDDGSFRFGNPGKVNFNTATMISATIYF